MFANFKRNNFNSISVHDLEDLSGKINLIDVRDKYEYAGGHVPTANNIPMDTIIAQPEKYLDKSKEYHIICQSGARSSRTCDELTLKGYNVVNVYGGTGSYLLPLER